ncbi:MAG: hypothetical protein ACRDUY_08895, partial [Nitriliruptorales bacterium]
MAEQLITVSRVRDVIGSKDKRVDSGLPDALNACVSDLLNGAMRRAKNNGRKTVRPEDLAGPGAYNAESLTVASRVKAAVSGQDLRSDSGLVDALNGRVQAMLGEAADRAGANGRSTVRPHDLP